MITPAEFYAMEPGQAEAYLLTLPLSEQYLLNMRLVWASEPWKESPGGWSWEVVMQGYENIRQMEQKGETGD